MQHMINNTKIQSLLRLLLPAYLFVLAALGLYASSFYSFILFHSLVEVICAVVLLTIFVLAWNTRKLLDNHYILFLGISFLSSASFELVHLFAYKGFGVFPEYDSNLPTELWIAFRYMFSTSLLIAPFFITRRLNAVVALTVYVIITALLFEAIFSGVFPDCFIEGKGLTPFKIYSEFIIIFMLLAALVLLLRKRAHFDPRVLKMLVFSIVSAIAADASFTHYISAYGQANLVGHFFLFLSAALIYRAIVVTGVNEPMAIIFRNLEQSEERLRLIAETSVDLIFQLDTAGKVVFCSPAVTQYGYKVTEVIGKEFSAYVAQEDLDFAFSSFRRALEGEHLHALELRLLMADGSPYFAEINIAPIRVTDTIIGLQGISRDITARRAAENKLHNFANELQAANSALQVSRTAALNLMQDAVDARATAEKINAELNREIIGHKQAEEQVRASLAEKEVLLREVHHRVKNNLQVISSLISLQTDTLTDERMHVVLGDMRDRVRAMALVHEKLYQTGNLAQLNFSEYAASLLQYLWRSHGALAEKVQLRTLIAPIVVPIETAVPCGLILNELAGNALKHGFPNGGSGEVTVALEHDSATEMICLRVSDNGIGLPVGPDSRPTGSLGLRLVHILVGQLRGTLETGTGPGAEFRITFRPNGVQP